MGPGFGIHRESMAVMCGVSARPAAAGGLERRAAIFRVAGRTPAGDAARGVSSGREGGGCHMVERGRDPEPGQGPTRSRATSVRRGAGIGGRRPAPRGIGVDPGRHAVHPGWVGIELPGHAGPVDRPGAPGPIARHRRRRGGPRGDEPPPGEVRGRRGAPALRRAGPRRHGRGAQGHDADLGRDLAVKVLRQSFRDQPDMVRRFVEERRSAGSCSTPGSCRSTSWGAWPTAAPTSP